MDDNAEHLPAIEKQHSAMFKGKELSQCSEMKDAIGKGKNVISKKCQAGDEHDCAMMNEVKAKRL